jgi:DNA-binding NarL/FixJ family response regulator
MISHSGPPPALSDDVVLVVDDVPQSLAALCTELETDGYSVLIADSGLAALAILERVIPDAILMDGLMPGHDGFQTCGLIKANAAWSGIPVIFMTGLSDESQIVRGFEAGGVDYVVKPVGTQQVLARLATHVRNARAMQGVRDRVDVVDVVEPKLSSRLAAAALTSRETEVLSWVAKGKTNKDIADILGLSSRTVNKHLEHIFEKLGVETRAAAAGLASREYL